MKVNLWDRDRVVQMEFPQQASLLMESIPITTLKLADNPHLPFLKMMDNSEVNLYELNYLASRLIDQRGIKRLSAISEIHEIKSLTECTHYAIHPTDYVLISDFDDFNNDARLGEILTESGEMKLEEVPEDEQGWLTLGQKLKEELPCSQTKYGWLFTIREIELFNENQIPFYVRKFSSKLIECTLTNPETQKFAVIQLPLDYYDNLTETMNRLDLEWNDPVDIKIKNIELKEELYECLTPTLENSNIFDTNELASKLSMLDKEEKIVLENVLEVLPVDDYSQARAIISNLNDFEFLPSTQKDPYDYARHRMMELVQTNDRMLYEPYLDDYMDYQKMGESIFESECIRETSQGLLKIPEEFEDIVMEEQMM